eukprot:3485370-Pyramimonas_sp.AAC.1
MGPRAPRAALRAPQNIQMPSTTAPRHPERDHSHEAIFPARFSPPMSSHEEAALPVLVPTQ